MSELALIEVSGDSEPREQKRLLSWAYRLSRTGRVMLLLRGVSTHEADRMLDDVVRSEGHDVAGLRYAEPGDDEAIMQLAATTSLVVASTDLLRRQLESCGIVPLRPEHAEQVTAPADATGWHHQVHRQTPAHALR
jgi:hypothetical protein